LPACGLLLLRHKLRRFFTLLPPQQGHLGKVGMSALINLMRMVAIESGT
jgi:hypothetical protein